VHELTELVTADYRRAARRRDHPPPTGTAAP